MPVLSSASVPKSTNAGHFIPHPISYSKAVHLVGCLVIFVFFENQGRKRYCREVKLRPRAVMDNLDDDVEE